MITLTVGTTTLDLPDDLYWSDELTWSPVLQTVERTITGALVVQTAMRQSGRPITLQAIDGDSSWIARSALDQLHAWAAVAGQEMTLHLRGQARQVIFRHHDGEALQASPVVHQSDVQPDDWYTVTLRLMEI